MDTFNAYEIFQLQLVKRLMDIESIQGLLSFSKGLKNHLFFIGPLYTAAVLNIHTFIPNFEVITCHDPFFGAYPFITVPQCLEGNHVCSSSGVCDKIAFNQNIIDYMKKKDPQCKVLLSLRTFPGLQELYEKNGIEILGISSAMFDNLHNKVKIITLLKKNKIPFIPNICSKINNYQHFLDIVTPFGTTKIVVQSQNGAGGFGTMFISSQQDYKQYQSELQNGEEFRIMPFRRLKCFAMVGVATKAGTILGPLFSELIGHQKLTPYLGGYCGNEIRKRYFEDEVVQMKVRHEIFDYTEKFINFLYRQGLFRGTFGCDYSVDLDTNEVFFMEMNPRLTGSTTLSFQVYQAQGHKFPIILYHFFEYLGGKINLNVKALNEQWRGIKHYNEQLSHVTILSFNHEEECLPYTIPAGIWKVDKEALKRSQKKDLKIRDLEEGQIYYAPNKGHYKINLGFKCRIQDFNFKLNEEIKVIIDKFLQIRKGKSQVQPS